MSKMFTGSIDVSKITKEKLFKGKKGTYANVVLWINDEPDQFGNSISIHEAQTAPEREANEKKVYLGNLKLYEKPSPPIEAEQQADVQKDEIDELMF